MKTVIGRVIIFILYMTGIISPCSSAGPFNPEVFNPDAVMNQQANEKNGDETQFTVPAAQPAGQADMPGQQESERDKGTAESSETVVSPPENIIIPEKEPVPVIQQRDRAMPEIVYGDIRPPLFALQLSYGGFFPVGPYYYRYNAGHQVSCGVGLYRYNLWGIAPEFLFRYARLDSIESSGRADSTFDLFQFSLGLVYRYEFGMPKSWQKYAFFRRRMCFFARVTEGVTLVRYDADNEDHPLQEVINTFGLGTGLTYPVWKELRLGFELGYRVIFTRNNYLQGISLSLLVEYRV